MENKTSINHENGDDANRLLAAVDFNSPENQNRDKAIIGYGPVLKCKCEMPVGLHPAFCSSPNGDIVER